MFGQEVSRKDEFVLSVVGPQDSIFEPFTPDGKNIAMLYEEIYKKKVILRPIRWLISSEQRMSEVVH
jgi:hypothetical protein